MTKQLSDENEQKNWMVEKKGKINELDRSFDLAFRQSQTPQARNAAAWELIIHACRIKGIDIRQLRIDRSVEIYKRQHR